ncbi:TIGR04222 domain-containing membrane protein [Nocardia sp. ET3-3]|uniref:TIGR04222 domain-containing membrane protein n=1 Tax=Nocardia terrae TaxID=2675851 RepID=A0A7K1V078_9NOCA|nr:TIGR04222 domain-containing membrane protein [Nocardia terrae]MVU80043.1 TIGR04222 domain-containing membrane protein [Nocardia terrae]
MVLRTAAASTATDTWGISGPDFLRFYLIAAGLAVLFGFAWRTAVQRWPIGRQPAEQLRPSEAAMLADDRRPILAALAQLRGHRLVGATGKPVTRPEPTDPASLDPFSENLHAYLRKYPLTRRMSELEAATGTATEHLRRDLAERGYLFGERRRNALWAGLIPLAALILLGLVRVIAGMIGHHSVAFLEDSLVALAVLVWLVGRPPRLTHRGRMALARARSQNRHLRPANSPAYSAYGPDAAALAVALFGAGALWSFAPQLAGAVDATTGSWIHGSAGSSCSSGGSGGCGGGGGGGGCGGGGCGGGGCGG